MSIFSLLLRTVKNFFHLINAILAVAYYGYPARKLKVIGITGTDGKTTTVHLIYKILKQAGKKVSMVSTIYAEVAGGKQDTGFHVTTPSPWVLQKIVRRIVNRGGEYLVLEITSHALDQNRVFGVPLEIAVITNISHEHLDYHKNFANYLRVKAKILKNAQFCVLNRDDKNFNTLRSFCNAEVKTFAIRKKADYTLFNTSFTTKLPGKFNQYNCLAAISVAKILSIDDKIIKKAISSFSHLPGRMEEVRSRRGFKIFIDFAHKPNALKAALTTARKETEGKLIAVFGCAGERDILKRPMMGEIAAELSDLIVLTAEDPRGEDVRDIINQISKGCLKTGMQEADKKKDLPIVLKLKKTYFFKIPDRQEAINFAIRKLAKKSDLVIVMGKGHEKSLCYGKTEHPWDERKAIEKALYGTVKTAS